MRPARTRLQIASKDELIVRELADEVLVYDLRRDKAHCLNQTSAYIWKRCDGKTTVTDMATLLQREFAAPVEEDMVWLALKQLDQFKLVEGYDAPIGVSRRDLVRKYLPIALVLPVILSISSPAAAIAVSCRANGQSCTTGGQCCSGCCANTSCQPISSCTTT